jgi:cytochrome c
VSGARGRAVLAAGSLAAAAVAACGGGPASAPQTAAERGHRLILHEGCGTCHTIGGVERADGDVGPRLTDFRKKRRIAGKLPNDPDAVARWLLDPQAVKPNTLMPNLRLTPEQARDIAAYLYTQ